VSEVIVQIEDEVEIPFQFSYSLCDIHTVRVIDAEFIDGFRERPNVIEDQSMRVLKYVLLMVFFHILSQFMAPLHNLFGFPLYSINNLHT